MAILRNKDGSIAKFQVDDGAGHKALGHFEFMFVPSFAPGTRVTDLAFIIDEVTEQPLPNQADLADLRGATG